MQESNVTTDEEITEQKKDRVVELSKIWPLSDVALATMLSFDQINTILKERNGKKH